MKCPHCSVEPIDLKYSKPEVIVNERKVQFGFYVLQCSECHTIISTGRDQ